MKYVVVYERTPNNWAAYAPDVPGCVAVGDTREEVKQQITEAITFHLESLQEYGDPIPQPGEWTDVVEVEQAARA